MVSSIAPGATSAGALGVDQRYQRSAVQTGLKREGAPAAGDRVDLSGPAGWASARESVAAGLMQLQQALAVARDAQGMLLKAQSLAADANATQSDLSAALGDYGARFDAAVAQGATLIAGQNVSVQAEPGGAPLTIVGANLGLMEQPGVGDVLAIATSASLDDRDALQQAVQASLDGLQRAMEGFGEASRALEAHQGFLGAAQGAASNVDDLNADSARLLALQVRQGLEAAGGGIANVEPQAVLALFRA